MMDEVKARAQWPDVNWYIEDGALCWNEGPLAESVRQIIPRPRVLFHLASHQVGRGPYGKILSFEYWDGRLR